VALGVWQSSDGVEGQDFSDTQIMGYSGSFKIKEEKYNNFSQPLS
jgi:hypothetical protein